MVWNTKRKLPWWNTCNYALRGCCSQVGKWWLQRRSSLFPPSSLGTFWYNPHGWDVLPSYTWRGIEDGAKSREPNLFHMLEDIMHVDVPSSMMDQWMMMSLTMTDTWKATDEGSHGSPLSRSKVMRFTLKGSKTLSTFNNSFRWEGNYWKTSRVDMMVGDCAKLYTML